MDFGDFEMDKKTIAIISVVLLLIIGAGWYYYAGHKGGNQPVETTTPQQSYDFIATPLPDYMNIMSGRLQNNTLLMPLDATKIYASGSIFTYQYNNGNPNIIGSTIASLFISGEITSPEYILFAGTNQAGEFFVSYFVVNDTPFLVVKDANGNNIYTSQQPSGIPLDEKMFDYTNASAEIVTANNSMYVHVYKVDNNTTYDWFFGDDRIVYQVSYVANNTTYETTMYIQVEAPSDMWGTQPLS